MSKRVKMANASIVLRMLYFLFAYLGPFFVQQFADAVSLSGHETVPSIWSLLFGPLTHATILSEPLNLAYTTYGSMSYR